MKKIAIPVNSNNQLEDHFGHCDHYEIYSITDNKIISIETIEAAQGCGCKSNIASVLAEHGVTDMLAGGIGNGAINVLNACNINVIRGCNDTPATLVTKFIDGKIVDSGISCTHHKTHQCNH